MNRKYLKFTNLFLGLILVFGMVGCNSNADTNSSVSSDSNEIKETKIDFDKLLKYKDSYIGDNSAVSNIVYNLPGSSYNTKIELQTANEPYELNLSYKKFKYLEVDLGEGEKVKLGFDEVLRKDAYIIFSLVNNVSIINFNIDGKDKITYKKEAIKEDLKNIIKSEESLKNFIIK